jgi:hypothetical protein
MQSRMKILLVVIAGLLTAGVIYLGVTHQWFVNLLDMAIKFSTAVMPEPATIVIALTASILGWVFWWLDRWRGVFALCLFGSGVWLAYLAKLHIEIPKMIIWIFTSGGPDTVTILLTLTTLVSVLLSWWLYHWRGVLGDDQTYLVPEKSLGLLRRLNQGVTDTLKSLSGQNQDIRRDMLEMKGTIMTMRDALDDRDAQIKRYRKGHDLFVFKQFLKPFIEVEAMLQECIQDESIGLETLVSVHELLEYALECSGVERFDPIVGSDYRKQEGLSSSPKKRETADREDNYKIFEVNAPGYRVVHSEGISVILPAKVTVNVYKSNQEGEE